MWFDRTVPAGGRSGNIYLNVFTSLGNLISLVSFIFCCDTGSVEASRRIYSYIEQALYFREDLKRYEMVKG